MTILPFHLSMTTVCSIPRLPDLVMQGLLGAPFSAYLPFYLLIFLGLLLTPLLHHLHNSPVYTKPPPLSFYSLSGSFFPTGLFLACSSRESSRLLSSVPSVLGPFFVILLDTSKMLPLSCKSSPPFFSAWAGAGTGSILDKL